MSPVWPSLIALRMFESAARHLSFKQAAQELCVSPAAVSQQVKALEEQLGVTLFVRLTRSLALTPQAQAMLPRLREALTQLRSALDAASQNPAEALTVDVPPTLANRWLIPRLADFTHQHPHIQLRITTGDDSVDRPGHDAHRMVASLPGDGARVSIRYGSGHYPGHHSQWLLSPALVAVCSPAWWAAHGPLTHPAAVAQAPLIHDEQSGDDSVQGPWHRWLQRHGLTVPELPTGLVVSNASFALTAALQGLGWALVIETLVQDELAHGRLLAPFPAQVPSRFAYHLVMQPAMERHDAVVSFRQWLQAQLALSAADLQPVCAEPAAQRP